MLSRKHFYIIADMLASIRGELPQHEHDALCDAVAAHLKTTNPRFNDERFIEASTEFTKPCGVDEEESE